MKRYGFPRWQIEAAGAVANARGEAEPSVERRIRLELVRFLSQLPAPNKAHVILGKAPKTLLSTTRNAYFPSFAASEQSGLELLSFPSRAICRACVRTSWVSWAMVGSRSSSGTWACALDTLPKPIVRQL